ncbi:MAG TPA: 4-(cytidine 5'-diphospho)-2-C-methyl-D-erythritol kinase [Acidimicrobiales bacterium]|nr:4-(cytidine 5'-diphospho)-2-C-methyl-D-erythritol kinase [Acidimicrobiales bacterium]
MTVVRAPAKLTLSLRVVGVRDDGYHLLDAEMVSLSLSDVLEITEGRPNDLPPDNLVSKALAAIGHDADTHVSLRKAIPAGAGLGGGSSDAAAVLRWAGIDDLALAASIGADVAFCLRGGRARVRGIGEIVEPLPFEDRVFTLLTPPVHVPTPVVYAEWDRLGGPSDPRGRNDLEPAALSAFPELASWRDRLGEATGETPSLAGSGGTWFVEGAYPDAVAGCVVTRTDRPEAVGRGDR